MTSCFLCTQVGMKSMQAAAFAKQLYTQTTFTVGDYLGLTHAIVNAKLSLPCVCTLDEYLQQFAGLPENRHAALGTAVPTRLLRVVGATALAHPSGVVWFYYAYHAATCTNVLSCTVSLAMSLLV